MSPGLLIIIALFAVLYFTMIRPQRARAQAQQRMLGAVEVGDEILTVGGLYGIVQEIEPDEEGGDLVVEIADGIHVRIARKALATVIKPEEDDDDEDEDDDDEDEEGGEATSGEATPALTTGVEEVTNEGETVNPGAAEPAAPAERS